MLNNWITDYVHEPLAKIVWCRGAKITYWLFVWVNKKEPEMFHFFFWLWWMGWPIAFFLLLGWTCL